MIEVECGLTKEYGFVESYVEVRDWLAANASKETEWRFNDVRDDVAMIINFADEQDVIAFKLRFKLGI